MCTAWKGSVNSCARVPTSRRHELANLGEGALEAALGLHANFQGVQRVDGPLRGCTCHCPGNDVAGGLGVHLQDVRTVNKSCDCRAGSAGERTGFRWAGDHAVICSLAVQGLLGQVTQAAECSLDLPVQDAQPTGGVG